LNNIWIDRNAQGPSMRSIFAGLCFVLSSSALTAADKAGDDPALIRKLVDQLGDRSFRVRQAAGRSLEEIGEPALPVLREAAAKDDEEVRRRAEVLLERVERTALLAPRRVTLQMKNRPIDEVVRELSKQSGYKLQFQGGQPRKITLEMENVTYWHALEKLCELAGLSPGFDDQQNITYLYQQNTVSPYTYHTGPFRLVAQNFNYSRFVNLANIPRNANDPQWRHHENNNLNFGFLIQGEPKVPILGVGVPRLTKAEDENGISLLPRRDGDEERFANAQFHEINGMFRNSQHSTGVALAKPAKDATTARIIKGKMVVTVLSGTRPDIEIDAIAKGKKKLTGVGRSAEITVEEVNHDPNNNNTWTLTLLIKRNARDGDAQDFNWSNSIHQRLELTDAKGRKYQSQGIINFIDNTPASVHAVYQFSDPTGNLGAAKKLILLEWLTIQHEVEFEFKNLPLP